MFVVQKCCQDRVNRMWRHMGSMLQQVFNICYHSKFWTVYCFDTRLPNYWKALGWPKIILNSISYFTMLISRWFFRSLSDKITIIAMPTLNGCLARTPRFFGTLMGSQWRQCREWRFTMGFVSGTGIHQGDTPNGKTSQLERVQVSFR